MEESAFLFSGWEPILRILVVGTLTYAALIAMLRISGSRSLASLNAFDFIVTVAIGAVFGRTLTAKGVSLAEGLVALGLLIGLQFIISFFQVRSPAISRLITARPALLYYRGEYLEESLHHHRISKESVVAEIRSGGYASPEEVDAVVLETTGKLSVIPVDHSPEMLDGATRPPE